MDEILQTRLDLDEAITYFDKGIEKSSPILLQFIIIRDGSLTRP